MVPMDAARFETLLRSLATTPSRRGALRLLGGLTLGSLLLRDPLATAAKKGGKGKGKAKGKGKNKKGKKVTICHNGQTITVSRSALKGHTRHGDTEGPCPDAPPPPEPTCANDNQCRNPALPFCVAKRCVECRTTGDCGATEACEDGSCGPPPCDLADFCPGSEGGESICCTDSLAACCADDGAPICTVLTDSPNCGACGVDCAEVANPTGGNVVCCGDHCGMLTGSACDPDATGAPGGAVTCCGGPSSCKPSAGVDPAVTHRCCSLGNSC